MSLEQIFAQISEDANIEAQNILENAAKEEKKAIREAEGDAGSLKDKIIADAQKDFESFFRKEIVSRRLNAQKIILQEKKSQLDNCFQEALDKLITLDDGLYRNLIKNMLTEIGLKEEAEVIFSRGDRTRISQDYIHKISPHLKLSFTDDIQGGFMLNTREFNFDNSLGNILATLRPELEPKIAEILFKES